MQTCIKCKLNFRIFPEDEKFYLKMDVPAPRLCPSCRQQRRAAFRNEWHLYKRKCDFTGKEIISTYSQDKPYKIYSSEIWWGDKWDARDYGREFDFKRRFFEQFAELILEVPRIALFNLSSENSAYTTHAVYNKNCYMCANAGYCENCFYVGGGTTNCEDSADLTGVTKSQLLYESVDCAGCYNCEELQLCQNCSDSRFLYDCRGCRNCFLCWNLRNKNYCIENVQYSEEEYFKKLDEYKNFSTPELRDLFENLLKKNSIRLFVNTNQSENFSGDFIFNSKNIFWSFDISECEDLRYCYDAWGIKDCMDTYQTMDKAELHYETHASSESFNARFANISHRNSEISYTDLCFDSQQLFGCVGVRRAKNCIFNKQYAKAEYDELVARIIEHMKETGEWGEFFPMNLSTFSYDETLAKDFFPNA